MYLFALNSTFNPQLGALQAPTVPTQQVHFDGRLDRVRHPDSQGPPVTKMAEEAAQPIITSCTPVRVFKDHENDVFAIAVLPDCRRMVTGSADKMVRLWDLNEGVVLKKSMVGHRDRVQAVAVSGDGRLIVSGDDNGVLIAWDRTLEPLTQPIKAHSHWLAFPWIASLCFSPDGTVLATGSFGNTLIKLWSTKTWQQLGNPIDLGIFNNGCCIRYSPSGELLAIASNFSTQIWNSGTRTCVTTFKAQGHNVFGVHGNSSLVWTPDGTHLLSAINCDATIRVFDTSTWQQVGDSWKGHMANINAIALNPAGTLVASASDDMQVRVWRLSDQRTSAIFHHIGPVRCITFSTDGNHIFSGGSDKCISEWAVPGALLEDHPKSQTLTSKDALLEDTPKEQASNKDAPCNEELCQQAAEAERAIQTVIDTELDNAPLRLLDTTTGLLCDRQAQISAFKTKTEYKKLLLLVAKYPDLRTERIEEVVEMYFRCVMLSHRWEGKEPLLHDIQGKVVYELEEAGTIVKLQSFCRIARDAGFHWAWVDSCCIDQHDNVELQRSLNSMFAWYRDSALTIVYLSDVPPSSKSGALAKSAWNTRGWTVPEFLAPRVIRFYQQDWTPYLDDHSPNHKESLTIMHELEDVTGIDARALVAFQPGMGGAREKLQWVSTRVTTVQEDIAYSLFGIFGIQLPILYGENKQKALGRLLQEIVAQSGDISALDWVGKSSEFNSCLPADISSYEAPPCTPPSLSEDEIQTSVSSLRNTMAVELALKLYSMLDSLSAPRFANCRLHLPCVAFRVTEVRRRRGQAQGPYFTYEVKADGLQDLLITTEDKLLQFSRARPTRQTFVLVRPWDRCLLELPDTADDAQTEEDWSEPGSPLPDSPCGSLGENDPFDSESSEKALRLIVRLGQPFGAFLLAQQRGGEYRRIASDHDIVAHTQDMAAVHRMMDVRTLEIL
ncbi:WD40-repeat-containing domain protein [Suillus ampliporus]|nr:WD40-repeat-containing domain protein [Suillus ampliporus]